MVVYVITGVAGTAVFEPRLEYCEKASIGGGGSERSVCTGMCEYGLAREGERKRNLTYLRLGGPVGVLLLM